MKKPENAKWFKTTDLPTLKVRMKPNTEKPSEPIHQEAGRHGYVTNRQDKATSRFQNKR